MGDQQNSRRRPLLLAGLSLGLGVGAGGTPLARGYFPVSQSLNKSQNARIPFAFAHENILGTSMDLLVQASDADQAARCEAAILCEIERLRAILSTYDPASHISQVKNGAAVESPELRELLNAYAQWNDRTGGAIAVNMADVIALWRRASISGRVPDELQLRDAFDNPLALNVDALGKGYIIDRAVQVARQIAPAGLLNIGGDIRTWGDVPWTIGVADPLNPSDNAPPIARLTLKNAAVATSGDYARGFDVAGRWFSHIIDPRTLLPIEDPGSATVVAPDCLSANALSTAASVLGPARGQQLVESLDAKGYLLTSRAGGMRHSAVQLATEASAAWPKDYQMTIGIALKGPAPQADSGMGRRGGRGGPGGPGDWRKPYVAVWVLNASKKVVRTLAVWGNEPKYVRELSYWLNDANNQVDLRSITRPTRPAGQYSLNWDGKDDKGNLVPAGQYTVVVEVNREHGRHVKESAVINCSGESQSATIKATAESDESTIEYGPPSK